MENQFIIYDFGDAGVDIVHAGDPFQLVGGFQVLGDAFGGGELFYEAVVEVGGLAVYFF